MNLKTIAGFRSTTEAAEFSALIAFRAKGFEQQGQDTERTATAQKPVQAA